MSEEPRNVAYCSLDSFDKLMERVPIDTDSRLSQFLGLNVVSTPFMPNGIVRVVHADGRVQIIKIEPSEYYD